MLQIKTAMLIHRPLPRSGMLPLESPIHAMRPPPGAATPRAPAALRGSGAADGPSHDRPAEDGVLSDVWSVFQQLMQEVPADQPVLVLATMHCRRLPADLLRWFDHPQASAAASGPLDLFAMLIELAPGTFDLPVKVLHAA